MVQMFKQSIGMTPYQYLLQQRIERAKQLLKGDRSIMDIALLCGFNSHRSTTDGGHCSTLKSGVD
jgi:AraC family transcriptional regulator